VLSNTDIAELLAKQAEGETGILSRAFRRAARSAFLWPESASDLAAQNRSLTELRGIGPFIEKQIRRWLDKPPAINRENSRDSPGFHFAHCSETATSEKIRVGKEPARRRRYAAEVFIILGYSSRFVSLFSPDHSRPN
jgi:hypothetical protein